MLYKKLLREFRLNAGQFVTIFLMVLIASLAFAGVHAYMDGMADSGARYYKENNLEDLWLTGENFSREDLETVRNTENVKGAERLLSFQCTWIRDEGNVVIETSFIETNEISRFHVFEGEDFDPEAEGLWLDYYLARNLGVKAGDEISLSYAGFSYTKRVNGLIGTPDHVYTVKDSSVIFTDHTDFGFAYLSAKEFPIPAMCVFPQIIVDVDDTEKLAETKAALEEKVDAALAVTDRTASVSWAGYQAEIEEGQTYSVIFMAMFLFIAVLSVVTTMNRFVKKQRTTIGTLKALGFRRGKIIRHYVGFGFITSLLGVVLGTVIGCYTIGIFFLREEMAMFLVPDYSISLRPVVFIAGAGILAVITLVTYLSCRKILKESAAQALRTEQPTVKIHGRELLQKSRNVSFNTKWNLRDIRRNKARSLMAVAGIAGSCTLIVAAFGMRDSLQNYLKWEFGGILHYAYQLTLQSDYTDAQLQELLDQYGSNTSQTLPVEFYDSTGQKQANVTVVNDAPGLLRLSDHDRNYFEPEDDGIYLTEKLAKKSGLKEGDPVKWRILGEDTWYESPVTGLNRDPQNQQLSISRAYAESLGVTYRPDTLYTDEDLSGVDELPGVETISSVNDLASQMTSMLSVMDSFILILIVVSAILGFVIIYNMGILSLTEKNYQFATLKVLGFRHKAIRKIFMTQNLWLTIVSVLVGLPLGYLMTDYIFKEAIGDNYDFFAMIKWPTYVYGLVGTLAVSLLSSLYLARKLKKIDMVSSLKANE